MSVRIEHVAHLQELEIALELGGEVSAREIEPLFAGRDSLFLFRLSAPSFYFLRAMSEWRKALAQSNYDLLHVTLSVQKG